MNHLQTPNGGMPLHLDDLEFIQAAFAEGIKGVVAPYLDGSNNLILSGIEVTDSGTTIEVTEGYAVISGEVCFCPIQTVTVPNGNGLDDVYIVLESTFDPNGNDEFADLAMRDTHEVRRAKLVHAAGAIPIQSFLLSDAKRIAESINEMVSGQYIQEELTGSGGSLQNGFTEYEDAKRNKRFNEVFLSGKISSGSTNGNGSIILPVGMRPPHQLSFLCAMNKAPYFCIATLYDNGNIDFVSFPQVTLDPNSSEYVCLNSIRFQV